MKKLMLILLVVLLGAALTLAILARQEPAVVPAMTEVTPTPTTEPMEAPTPTPTAEPTEAPTATPTTEPTEAPTATLTAEPTEAPTPTPTEAPTLEAVGGEMTLKVPGYQSELTVSITVDGGGAITAMTVEAAEESPGLGRKCAEPRWLAQFIGRTAPFSLAGDGNAQVVDAVSYATITSQAIVDAVNTLMNAE